MQNCLVREWRAPYKGTRYFAFFAFFAFSALILAHRAFADRDILARTAETARAFLQRPLRFRIA